MVQRIDKHGLQVAEELAAFIEDEALPGTGVSGEAFWSGLASLVGDLAPANKALLERREELQKQIDEWHIRHRNQPHDHEAYKAFLYEIGYLIEEGPDFEIETENVDPEIAKVPGPQLVVPIARVSRFVAGRACREGGCLARHACPVGAAAAHAPAQAAFHMAAFLAARPDGAE